jgi:hypothetical protein
VAIGQHVRRALELKRREITQQPIDHAAVRRERGRPLPPRDQVEVVVDRARLTDEAWLEREPASAADAAHDLERIAGGLRAAVPRFSKRLFAIAAWLRSQEGAGQ